MIYKCWKCLNENLILKIEGFLPPRLPTTCLSMPPRFDRDAGMHQSSNGVMCNGTGNNGGMLTNGNSNGHMGANGPIGSNSAALRKPLLEINGSSSSLIFPGPCLYI